MNQSYNALRKFPVHSNNKNMDTGPRYDSASNLNTQHIISYVSHKQRTGKVQYETLHSDLLTAHRSFVDNPSQDTRERYLEAKRLMDAHTLADAKRSTELTRNAYFLRGGKMGCLRARLTKLPQTNHTIIKIHHPSTHQIVTDPEDI